MIDDSRRLSAAPPRIAFVVHVMQVAGAEVLIRETIRTLGHRITPSVFCLDRIGPIGEELQAQGVDVVCMGRRPGIDRTMVPKIARAARERQIDILHAHQYTPFFYSALAKNLLRPRPKLILTEHGRHYPDVVSPLRRATNRLLLDPLADAVNACCDFSALALSRNDGFRGNRIAVIANGIDTAAYDSPLPKSHYRAKLGLPMDAFLVVHVARHHPVKDQATLLRGFALAARQVPEMHLVLLGDGPLNADLKALTAELDVTKRVRFVGVQRNVPEWLLAADVFALTSVSEAASLTLLEAMAAGLPVVVSAVGGNGELARDGLEGWHFPRGDAARLAEALVDVARDPERARAAGDRGRTRVAARFQLRQTVASYAELYARLAGRASGFQAPPVSVVQPSR